MHIIYIALMFFSYFSEAQQPAPLASCLSYEVSRIDKDIGKLILKNVFAPQLFESLDKHFPDQDIDWSAWTVNVDEYIGEDGEEKTKLKGCFDITEVVDNNELISSIMRVSMTRFQAAMKFYSKPNNEQIPQSKIESMLDRYEDLLKNPKFKQTMKDALEHNNQVQPALNSGSAN